jgi:hypothetical protein
MDDHITEDCIFQRMEKDNFIFKNEEGEEIEVSSSIIPDEQHILFNNLEQGLKEKFKK